MPIISRQLDYARPQADGTVRVRESAVDHLGRRWMRGPRRAVSQAAAEAEMNAYDWQPQLQSREERNAAAFVEAGGDPSTLTGADMTTIVLIRRLLKRWWKEPVEGRKLFVIRLATWIAGKTVGEIETALGISTARATALHDRAVTLAGMRAALEADSPQDVD